MGLTTLVRPTSNMPPNKIAETLLVYVKINAFTLPVPKASDNYRSSSPSLAVAMAAATTATQLVANSENDWIEGNRTKKRREK